MGVGAPGLFVSTVDHAYTFYYALKFALVFALVNGATAERA